MQKKTGPSFRDGMIGNADEFLYRKQKHATETTNSYRPYRDGPGLGNVPGNKLPGYDHVVPTGQRPRTCRAVGLAKAEARQRSTASTNHSFRRA
jgi:hypothetical protein